MIKVLSIFGTRPEAIKMAPLIKELEKYPEVFKSVVCVTAQHREMLDQVLKIFDIHPYYDLKIMQPKQDLFDVTTKVVSGLKPVLHEVKPDIVLVHGDTTTTMAAAIASFYCQTKIGHVEAGLRSFNKYAPFPEEVNRVVADRLSDFHFAPTETAKQNLLREGIVDDKIYVTGNTVVDALIMVTSELKKNNEISSRLDKKYAFLDNRKKLILVTGHRRENFGEGFHNICSALMELAQKRRDDVEIIYPVHLNPNVQAPVNQIMKKKGLENVHLIEPVDYLPFVYLMNRSYIVITDSGGVQEEAPSLGKPVLVMRETTERPEAVTAGTVKLVGTNRDKIVQESLRLLDDATEYKTMSYAHNPYGNGRAAELIVNILTRNVSCRS